MIEVLYYFVLILQVLLVVLAAIYLYDDWRLGVAAVPSSTAAVRTVSILLPDLPGDSVVDMGSGWGGMALAAARACPDKQIIGIEYAWLPFVWSKLRHVLNPGLNNLRFERADLFKWDFTHTAIVFCYMPTEMMERLRPKFDALPSGAHIVSNSAPLQGWTPIRQERVEGLLTETIFIYRVA